MKLISVIKWPEKKEVSKSLYASKPEVRNEGFNDAVITIHEMNDVDLESVLDFDVKAIRDVIRNQYRDDLELAQALRSSRGKIMIKKGII